MKKAELHQRGLAALQASLDEVPFAGALVPAGVRPGIHPPDACMQLDLPDGPLTLFIELRPNGQPRTARSAANHLQTCMLLEPGAYGLLIAPYISPAAAGICAQAGVGTLDLAGNCRLAFRQVYIHQQGRPNPFSQRRELASLYSPAAERILRVLLEHPFQIWKTLPLAEAAGVSPGMITRVKNLLAGEEWLHIQREGFALTQPQALLMDWRASYTPRCAAPQTWRAPRGSEAALAALAKICARQQMLWALNGSSAAARLLGLAAPHPETVCIQGDPAALAATLGLRPADADGDLLLAQVLDDGVWLGKTRPGPWPLVSAVQACLDLSLHTPSAPQADALLETILMLHWARLQNQSDIPTPTR